MLYRKIEEKLQLWEKGKKALLVYGARQVGKTTSIKDFCQRHFANVAAINFTNDARALNLLLEIKNLEEFNRVLSLLFGFEPKKGDTDFLDEIQYYYEMWEEEEKRHPGFKREHVDILTLAKNVVERNEYRLILSGSMLGVSVFGVNLNPTGFVEELTMYPLDFEEFLLALSTPKNVIEEARESFASNRPMPEELNDMLIRRFREYTIIGGMPEAVEAYVETKDMRYVSAAHRGVLSWYRRDIIKYAPADSRLIISSMFEALPSEISAQNKKFVKSHMDVPNFKNLELRERFLWLQSAGIAIPTYNVDAPKSPLKAAANHKVVKLFSNDVGLLVNQLFDGDVQLGLIEEKSGYDFGAIYENAVAELLVAHGFSPYFHSNKKGGEIDFLVEKNRTAIPIEIKSGAGGERHIYEHKALDHLLESRSDLRESFVFGNTNVFSESKRIKNYPIYMIEFLKRKD